MDANTDYSREFAFISGSRLDLMATCFGFQGLQPDEDGVFLAECPALPGGVSQGKTRDEAMANVRDAIQGYLASLKKHDETNSRP